MFSCALRFTFARKGLFAAAALTAALLVNPSARAQELPNMVDVAIVHVQIGMTAEFEAVQKDLVAQMKKSGSKQTRLISSTVRGDTGEYRIVTPIENYAYLDEPEQAGDAAWQANWVSRVTKFISSRETLIAEVMKELSNPWEGQSPMGSLIRLTIAEGKLGEFDDLIKNEWMPMRKKLGLRGPVVYRPRYGERSRRLRAFAFPKDDWASSDEPGQFVEKGGEPARAIQQKFLGLITDSSWIITRYRADLSYVPE